MEYKKQNDLSSIYFRCLINKNVLLPITTIGDNLKQTLENKISDEYEGKCIQEGFIKKKSTSIINFSSGLLQGNNVSFHVVFECQCCFPVEGMLIECIAKNITKAGIRAEYAHETPSPIVVFVARDHHYASESFSKIKEQDKFLVRVIGQRFNLNDKYISIIGEIKSDNKFTKRQQSAPQARITIEE
jgi:DNA-directed RNA polymerase subunit E'/Rpb7